MKKLLGIVVLGLLLVGCSNKKEVALENCADAKLIDSKDESFDKSMGSGVGMIVRNWGKDKTGEEYLKRGGSLNKKLSEDIESHNGKVSKKLSQTWADRRANAKKWIIAGYDQYGLVAYKIVPKTSLKKKTKWETYANLLIDCEKLYNETPDSFVLKWKN